MFIPRLLSAVKRLLWIRPGARTQRVEPWMSEFWA
jgi:hypothetical protein